MNIHFLKQLVKFKFTLTKFKTKTIKRNQPNSQFILNVPINGYYYAAYKKADGKYNHQL